MQKLYRILTLLTFPHIPTEGRKCDESTVAYLLAKNDEEIYDYIESRFYQGHAYQEPGWCAYAGEPGDLSRKKIIKKKGDYTMRKPAPPNTFFWNGEFQPLGFRWEDLGEVSPEEIATLQRLGILPR